MFHPGQKTANYLSRVQRVIRPNGERFVTVVDVSGAPTYYPTALALSRRSRGLSAETLAADASDLVHIGLWALRERIDINGRLEAGAYFCPVAIETLAEACSLKTNTLRKITSRTVSEIRRGVSFSKTDLVTNQQKSRRLSTALRYFDLVGRMSEAWLPKRSENLADRVAARDEMSALIKEYRPKIMSSRIRGVVRAGDLARVAAFVATENPTHIWPGEALACRNWALISLLVASGIR